MFGSLARCSLCDNKNCSCSAAELEAYAKRCEENRNKKTTTFYSTTEPKVSYGDLVVTQEGWEVFVNEIKEGFPYGTSIYFQEAGPFRLGQRAKIEAPYKKIVCLKEIHEMSEEQTINVDSKDFISLLETIDFMAQWINNIGKGDYSNGMRKVLNDVEKLKSKYTKP